MEQSLISLGWAFVVPDSYELKLDAADTAMAYVAVSSIFAGVMTSTTFVGSRPSLRHKNPLHPQAHIKNICEDT
jgi:hypothetical protein